MASLLDTTFELSLLRVGLKSLLLHKLRAFLAILGIFIGVTAVIWLVAMGEGVSYQAQQQIKDLGANNIILHSKQPPQDSSRNKEQSRVVKYGLLRDDVTKLKANVPTLTQIVPLREIKKEARFMSKATDSRVVGCTPEYFELNRLTVTHGRALTDRECDHLDNVCVLASHTSSALFPIEDPIGKVIQLERGFYTVVGVTAERTPSAGIGGSFSGQDYNRDVYIPLTVLRARFGDMVSTARPGSFGGEDVQLSQVTVSVDSMEHVDQTAKLIETILAENHPDQDYDIVVPKELLRQSEILRIMFNLLLILIAGIALLVGGIGIMNIMLATVTERTREIGIRRALGAKRSDIVAQFLMETIGLSATGGILGVLWGFSCPMVIHAVRWLLTRFLPDVMSSLPANIKQLEPRIAPWSVASAFLISVGVGVIFGIYPARRAAYMDPIEALRHE
jgi:putative ABC transport system permease protein